MKTESWARWSEIIASVAVVVTLGFLVLELRTTRQMLERQATLDRASVLLDAYVEHPQLAEIQAKIQAVEGQPPEVQILIDRYDLSDAEAVTKDRHLWSIWFGANADYQLDGGTAGLTALIRDMNSGPFYELWWPIAKEYGYFDPDFVAFVERVGR